MPNKEFKQSQFFAVESSNPKKVKNFIKLAKRMGIPYNNDFTVITNHGPYNHLGFSNYWDCSEKTKGLTCSFTSASGELLINIDTPSGYIKAVKMLIDTQQELIEYDYQPIRCEDRNLQELFIGDNVVAINIDGVDSDCNIKVGQILEVTKIIDAESNHIELDGKWGLFGDRFIKIQN